NMPPGNISGYLPEGISALKSLQQISVSLLTNLTSIELPNNNITGSIPTSWFQLRDLEFLDLSRNRLTSSLPDAFDSLFSLQLLNLSSNSFSGTLPPSIGSLNFLEKLDLHSNPFSGSLPAALAQLSSLTLLDIAATGLLCPLQGTCPSHTVSMSSLYCEFCSSFCRYCNDPNTPASPWMAPAPVLPSPCLPSTANSTPPSAATATIPVSGVGKKGSWSGEEGELVSYPLIRPSLPFFPARFSSPLPFLIAPRHQSQPPCANTSTSTIRSHPARLPHWRHIPATIPNIICSTTSTTTTSQSRSPVTASPCYHPSFHVPSQPPSSLSLSLFSPFPLSSRPFFPPSPSRCGPPAACSDAVISPLFVPPSLLSCSSVPPFPPRSGSPAACTTVVTRYECKVS
ncbi:unnamed protein product, partial [Closterium sp. NIES-54]